MTFIISYHHSEACLSVSLGCIVLRYLIFKKPFIDFWLGIRTGFPTISEIALNILLTLCVHIYAKLYSQH